MEPAILPLLRKSDQQLHLCVSFVLLWIASSDGQVDHSEREFIFRHIATEHRQTYDQLLKIAIQQDLESFLIVCKALRNHLDEPMREPLLVLAIGVAVADRRLSISENHILRFLADIVGYSADHFSALYREVTGSPFPGPGDPSSVEWWQSKQADSQRTGDHQRKSEHHRSRSSRDDGKISRDEAHVILGIQAGASKEDVRRAYKRLVHAHHPDRFSSLGPEAAEAAHAMFIRIQLAYKVLAP